MRGGRGRGYGGMQLGSHRPRNPQNNIPRQLQPQQSHSAPLVTDHLQGLKDIDMELELLKRKREIIEQQQQILSNSYRQRNDFEQPAFNQARDNRYDDYTRLYDNPREPEFARGNRGGRNENRGGRNDGRGGRNDGRVGRNDAQGGRNEGARKRPHIPVWESEESTPPKRFSAPTRGSKRPPGPRFSSAPNRPRPELPRPQPLFPDLRPAKRPPPPPQKKKEFNPTKVSKPTAAPPLKLANYQPAERKKLVTAAVASTAAVDDSLILRADREPTHLMVGRLELTLGAIMKDIKSVNPDHEILFKTPHVMRAMKQCLRDRIRTAMIGKAVSNTDHIKTAYYDMFPFGNDDEVIMKGLMAQQNKNFITVDTAYPETYFKKNMRNLMILKLEEMTNKLQEIYSGGGLTASRVQARNRVQVHKYRPFKKELKEEPPKAQSDTELKSDESQTKDNIVSGNETETTEPPPKEDLNQTNDAVVSTDDTVVPIQEEANVNESAENQPEAKIQPEAENQNAAETQPKNENLPEAENELKADIVEPVEPAQKSTFVVPNELVTNEQYKALDKLMSYKMVHLLKKFTPDFVRFMDLDAMFRKTKAAIIAETAKKMKKPLSGAQVSATIQAVQAGTEAQNATAKNTPDKPRLPLHFVKILGKPSLPKRKAMEAFFNEFKPKSIKKHKSVHNLLFVGFLDKEAYDNILAADGTTIGRFTLDIKVSERNDGNKNRNNNKPQIKAETANLNESTDSLIGADIDDQITNLLTSINSVDDSEDVVMAEPPTTDQSVKEFGDQVTAEVVDCDADQNANNVANDEVGVAAKNVTNDDTTQNDIIEIQDEPDNDDVVEVKDAQNNEEEQVQNIEEDQAPNNEEDQAQNNEEVQAPENEEAEKNDTVDELKADVKDVKGTPTRASARLATPGGIRTRRMSKLNE